jgi:hypothetical protein
MASLVDVVEVDWLWHRMKTTITVANPFGSSTANEYLAG